MARPLPEFLPINEWFDRPPDAFWFTHARPFSCGPDDFPGIRKRPVRLPYPGPDQEAAERFNRLSPLDKLGLAIRMALLSVPGAAGAQVAIFAEPKNVAIAAGALAIWVGSHGTPVGIVVDILMLGMGVVGLGLQVQQVAWMLTCFARGVVNAENEAQLRQASNYLSQAVAIIGVDVVVAILLKKAVFRVRTRPASQEAGPASHPASPRSTTASVPARLDSQLMTNGQSAGRTMVPNRVAYTTALPVGETSPRLTLSRQPGIVIRNALSDSEFTQAQELATFRGGNFVGAPRDNFPGIDGWLDGIPTQLKLVTGNGEQAILRNIVKGARNMSSQGYVGDIAVDASRTEISIDSFAKFVTPSTPVGRILNEGSVNNVYIKLSDGWLNITQGTLVVPGR